MAPEERLQLILHQFDELRGQPARERLAAAAAPRRASGIVGTRSAVLADWHHLRAMASRAAAALNGRHGGLGHGGFGHGAVR